DASGVFLFVLLACSIQNISVMFLSIFKGIQRMDKYNAIEIKMSVVNVVGTVFFLESGFGMRGLAMNALICAVISTVLTWYTVRRYVPKVRLGWHFNSGLLREMFAYGAKMQVSAFGGQVCFQVDKLII